ncbi:MAG: hypothetical protein GKR77_05310 [Legionellales bacterium]|nr:hypothetical protein [Legionellales bacterium]
MSGRSNRSLTDFFRCKRSPVEQHSRLIAADAPSKSDYGTVPSSQLSLPLTRLQKGALGSIALSHGLLQAALTLKFITWIPNDENLSNELLYALAGGSILSAIPVTYYLSRRIAVNLRQGLDFPVGFWQWLEQLTLFSGFASLQFGELTEQLIELLHRTTSMSKEEILEVAKNPGVLSAIALVAAVEGYGALMLNGVESHRFSQGQGPLRALLNICRGPSAVEDEGDFKAVETTLSDRGIKLFHQLKTGAIKTFSFPNHAAAGALGGLQLLAAISLLAGEKISPFVVAPIVGFYATTIGIFETITQLGASNELAGVVSHSELEHQWFNSQNSLFLLCAFLDGIAIPLGFLELLDYLFEVSDVQTRMILFTLITVITTATGTPPIFAFFQQLKLDDQKTLFAEEITDEDSVTIELRSTDVPNNHGLTP